MDPRCRVVVVDDGSRDADGIARVARDAGASVVRLDPGRGPSAARNAGLRAVTTPFVAFVDSDCVVPPGFPGRLLDHLRDPALAVAVPRIVGLADPCSGWLARYEADHSALDMGRREGLVRSGTAIPYAPSAALVARVAALGAGFAEDLHMGEDVDLLWRLNDAGWQVRYDPAVTVAHDHRVGWRPWFRRRIAYNESNAALLRRHPGKVPALSISRGGTRGAPWLARGSGSSRSPRRSGARSDGCPSRCMPR
jgi:mycofactocin system glycosyltransferase